MVEEAPSVQRESSDLWCYEIEQILASLQVNAWVSGAEVWECSFHVSLLGASDSMIRWFFFSWESRWRWLQADVGSSGLGVFGCWVGRRGFWVFFLLFFYLVLFCSFLCVLISVLLWEGSGYWKAWNRQDEKSVKCCHETVNLAGAGSGRFLFVYLFILNVLFCFFGCLILGCRRARYSKLCLHCLEASLVLKTRCFR